MDKEQAAEMRKRTIPERSADSDILYHELLKVPVGEIITYEQLTQRIGRDVRGDARGNMQTALRAALGDRVAFACVRTVGFKRLDDVGKVNAGASRVQRIRRTAIGASKVLAAVEDFDALPPDEKVRHNQHMSVFGALRQFTKPSSLEKVKDKVKEVGDGRLSVAGTLGLFAGK